MDSCTGRIIWLASYPKSGNTWFRVFLTNLLRNTETPADLNDLETSLIASGRKLFDLHTGVESSDLTWDEIERLRPSVYEAISRESETRDDQVFMKIHDAFTRTCDGSPLVSRKATRCALYFLRNPLDVAVSFAHHMACDIDHAIDNMADESHSLNQARNRIGNQFRQRLLSWSGHVTSWVDGLGPALHLIRYEDMIRSPLSTFTLAARFAQVPGDGDQIKKAIAFSDIRELQQQERDRGFKEKSQKAASFFRKGTLGSWRESLSPEQVRRIIGSHHTVMKRFGYLDANDEPVF